VSVKAQARPFRLAVASGKGGTGKTTVAVNLARAYGTPVQVLDCDVEAPNAGLFLRGAPVSIEEAALPVPSVDESRCDGCGQCGSFCRYHSLVCLGAAPLLFPELCHGCGGCALVCPRGAIREAGRRIGLIETFDCGGVRLVQGKLDVGVSMAPPLIRAVKAKADCSVPVILDAPPGTSCPVVTTLRGADFVLLVTEPTPFGLNDLALAVEMTTELGLPCGVALNRAGSGDDRVKVFCRERNVPLLAEIPDDRRIAEAYSRGELIVEALPGYRSVFLGLLEAVRNWQDKKES